MDVERQLQSIEIDGGRIGELTAAAPTDLVVSCPEWTGRDLRVHVGNFARLVCDLVAARGAQPEPRPTVAGEEAVAGYDADLAGLVATLRDTDPDAPAHVWSVTPPVAGFWTRRALHELAVHRWDAETIGGAEPAPIPTDTALDGIAEYFEVFVATGLAAGMVPPSATTLVLQPTDVDQRIEHDLGEPGPVTTIRGTASDLLLALWRRRDPLSLHVGGDPAPLAGWPSI
jgi:uncharacterized protein (TIGR03083 family)